MSIKDYPLIIQDMVARDELYDAIDTLALKISQCRNVGLTNKQIQLALSCYHSHHIDYPLIQVLE